MISSDREAWAALPDRALLDQCEIDLYRASGPGGQKRNKTSSAVRLRHIPSGVTVIAEESRSQAENKARALRRLRREILLVVREPVRDEVVALAAHPREDRYWIAAARVLDALEAHRGRVSAAAAALGTTTAPLVAFLRSQISVWRRVNELRQRHGCKPLHD